MTQDNQPAIQRFIRWGQSRLDARDRGVMADLRRGFSPGTENRCWPYIAKFCNIENERERRIWQCVAAGFATHEGTAEKGNIGTTLRTLALDGSAGEIEDALSSFDARFRRLLSCSSAIEVCDRLPGILRAAKNKGIPVNYERLFHDLLYWGNGEKVKVRWASAYWGDKSENGAEGAIS